MATPNQIDTRGATQTSERDEDAASVNSVTNLDIPALIVPDLNNTPLEEAIKDGMKVGPAEFLINTPLLKEHIGVEHLKVFLPSGRLETNSERPIKFVTDCQDSPFPEEVLVSALKTFKIENPITQYIPGDEWPITSHRFLTKQELEDRLAAYCEIGVKYWKYVFELETNSLLTMNNEDRLRANEGLEQSIQRISDRLDEILVILTRDNSRRKAYGKQTYPLPKTKPRMEIIQNAEDAFQMGRRMMTEHDSIVAQAFNEESPDIPNATPAEGHGTTGGKEKPTQSKPQPGQPVTATITRGKEQHTVNFNFTKSSTEKTPYKTCSDSLATWLKQRIGRPQKPIALIAMIHKPIAMVAKTPNKVDGEQGATVSMNIETDASMDPAEKVIREHPQTGTTVQLVDSLVTPHATVWPELENSFTVTNVTRETTRRQIVGVHQDKTAEATVLQGTTIPTTFRKITI